MAPYRQPPAQSTPRADDPESVRKWFAIRDHFGPLGDRDLWPPAPVEPFDHCPIDAFAVSGDGKVAYVQVDRRAWLVDTETLATRRLKAAPDNARKATLSDDGSRAVLVCGQTIYVWDVASAGRKPVAMWQSDELSSTEFLSMSADGKTAAACADRQDAEVRVFDLERRTLVYSFKTYADEYMQLHSGGRHIVCFGDDGVARIYGSTGLQRTVENTTGGAFSRDGTWLITNDFDHKSTLRLYGLDVSDDTLTVGGARSIEAGVAIPRWHPRFRFSPSGSQVLIGVGDQSLVVELAGERRFRLAREMTLSGAILADETRAFLGPSYHDSKYRGAVVAVAEWSAEGVDYPGAIAATRRDRAPTLVGTSPLGFFGSLEAEPTAIGDSLVKYYERPGIMPSILGGGAFAMDRADELRAQEVAERAAVWKPYLAELTADIDHRSLMDLNRGIVHLTPAIASRAKEIDSDAVRFGASQLSWDALSRASAEIRGMSGVEQGRLFDEMVNTLRRSPVPDSQPGAELAVVKEQVIEVRGKTAVATGSRAPYYVGAGLLAVVAVILGFFFG